MVSSSILWNTQDIFQNNLYKYRRECLTWQTYCLRYSLTLNTMLEWNILTSNFQINCYIVWLNLVLIPKTLLSSTQFLYSNTWNGNGTPTVQRFPLVNNFYSYEARKGDSLTHSHTDVNYESLPDVHPPSALYFLYSKLQVNIAKYFL